jgi:hypothetical protein
VWKYYHKSILGKSERLISTQINFKSAYHPISFHLTQIRVDFHWASPPKSTPFPQSNRRLVGNSLSPVKVGHVPSCENLSVQKNEVKLKVCPFCRIVSGVFCARSSTFTNVTSNHSDISVSFLVNLSFTAKICSLYRIYIHIIILINLC